MVYCQAKQSFLKSLALTLTSGPSAAPKILMLGCSAAPKILALGLCFRTTAA